MPSPEQVMNELRSFMESVLPGSLRRAPASMPYDFAVAVPGGGSVLLNAPNEAAWFLTITSGIAHDVSNIPGALAWANAKNSDHKFGRYYVSLPASGEPRCNVVYQNQLFSGMLDMAPSLVRDWLPQIVKLGVEVSSNEPQEFIATVGGSAFEDRAEDFILLGAASFG